MQAETPKRSRLGRRQPERSVTVAVLVWHRNVVPEDWAATAAGLCVVRERVPLSACVTCAKLCFRPEAECAVHVALRVPCAGGMVWVLGCEQQSQRFGLQGFDVAASVGEWFSVHVFG